MFWRGVAAYLPVQAVNAVVGVASILVFTRLLTPEEYGRYALAFSATAILHTVLLAWIEAAMDRFHVAETERGEAPSHLRTIYAAFTLLALAAALATVVALAILPLDPALELALAVAVGAAVARTAKRLVQKRRRAEGQVRHYAVTSIASTLGGLALGILCAKLGMGGAAPIAGGLAAALAFLLIELGGELKLTRGGRAEPARARRYAAYGLPVAFSALFGLVLTSADRFLLAAFMDEAAVGVYQAGYAVASRTLDIVFIWLGLAGAPAAVAALERGGRSSLQEALRSQAQLMALLTIPAAAGLALVAEPLVRVAIGGPMQNGAARIVPWIAASGLLAGWTTHYLSQAFTLGRRPGLLFISMAPPAAANIGLNLLLIPRFGLDGAMWATTISFGVGAASAYGFSRAVLPLPLPGAMILRSVAGSLVMSAAVLAVPPLEPGLALIVEASVGAGVYALVLLLLEVPFPSSWGGVLKARLAARLRALSTRGGQPARVTR